MLLGAPLEDPFDSSLESERGESFQGYISHVYLWDVALDYSEEIPQLSENILMDNLVSNCIFITSIREVMFGYAFICLSVFKYLKALYWRDFDEIFNVNCGTLKISSKSLQHNVKDFLSLQS